MKRKRIVVGVTVVLIASIFFYYLINKIYRAFTPICFDNIELSVKGNATIINKIGGYNSKYSEVELENYNAGKPAAFELRILGNRSIVTFTGSFQKETSGCRVLKIDTIYSNYE